MKNNNLKFLAMVGFVVVLLVGIGFRDKGAALSASDVDPAAVFKSKCAMCHSLKAEKHFDLSKTDEHHIDVILKGKKDAKPPMPEFGTKGVTPEGAKALVNFMRSLRTPAGANVNTNANSNANTNVNANATVVNANTNANANANKPANSNQ